MDSQVRRPPTADIVLVSVNPTAGPPGRAGNAVDRLHSRLIRLGYRVEVFDDRTRLTAQADQYAAEGRIRAVVAAGGDGTCSDLWNRLGAKTPLIPLGLGNENLLARHLGLGSDPEAVAEAIDLGLVAQIDGGEANGRLFSLMCSCGFDADVVGQVHRRRNGHVSPMDYWSQIVESARTYDYPPLRLSVPMPSDMADDWGSNTDYPRAAGWLSVEARWVFAFNLPCYGGGLQFAPGADPLDGMLDVCTFEKGHLRHGLGYLLSVLTGRQRQLKTGRQWRVNRLRIESEVPVPFQLDGDPGGMTPLEINLVPRRLSVIAPERWLQRSWRDRVTAGAAT